jgi:hypothetical protein
LDNSNWPLLGKHRFFFDLKPLFLLNQCRK